MSQTSATFDCGLDLHVSAHTDAIEVNITCSAAAERRPAAQLPPPPAAFSRQQSLAAGICKARTTSYQDVRSLDFIQCARRNVFEEIFGSELCPVANMEHEVGLWAAVEDVFLQ